MKILNLGVVNLLSVAVFLFFVPQVYAASIFWASDPIGPGETVMLVGEDFGTNPVVRVRRIAEKKHGKGLNGFEPILISQFSSRSIKFKIPKQWKNGVFEVEVTGVGGKARTLLNVPAIYWVQGDLGTQASPEGWLRAFGRNIGAPGRTATVSMSNKKSGKTYLLKATSGGNWDARFIVPSDIVEGDYEVLIHNGWGANRGWVNAGSLNVAVAEVWPSERFNVKDFGAKGNGVADDGKAISAALEEAGRKRGGVVYLPRGRYLVSQMLTLPRFVELKGEGEDLSALMFADLAAPPATLIRGSNHFRLSDLAIYASNHNFIIKGDVTETKDGAPGYVSIQRVRVRAMKYGGHITADELDRKHRESFKTNFETEDTLRLGGANIRIADSDFYGSARSLALSRPIGAYVVNNRFSNGRAGWYSISGADGVIFENNTIVGADLMATGGGVNNLGDYAYSQNVWFGHNHFETMSGFDREAVTTDGPGGFYYGSIVEADGATLHLSAPLAIPGWAIKDTDLRGAGVFILGGRGAGQMVRVKSVNDKTVELDHPFEIVPDASSVITIIMLQQNYLFIENTFVDTGLAIQYYGISVNNVAAGNKVVRGGGIFASGRWYDGYQPTWYCQFINNEISDGNTYRGGPNNETFAGESVLGIYGVQNKPPNLPILVIGEVLRRNRLLGNAHIEVKGGDNSDAPGVRDVIVENNVVRRANVPLLRDRGIVGIFLSGNNF